MNAQTHVALYARTVVLLVFFAFLQPPDILAQDESSIVAALRSSEQRERLHAIELLANIHTDWASNILLTTLNDQDPDIARESYLLLSARSQWLETNRARLLDVLIQVTGVDERVSQLLSLASPHLSAEEVGRIVAAPVGDDVNEKILLVWTLGKFEVDISRSLRLPAIKRVIALMSDEDARVRALVPWAYLRFLQPEDLTQGGGSHLDDTAARENVVRFLADPSATVRASALRGLSRFGVKWAELMLRAGLFEQEPVATAAVLGLADRSSEVRLSRVECARIGKFLTHPDSAVKASAFVLLQANAAGAESARESLRVALAGGDRSARRFGMLLIAGMEMDGRDFEPLLIAESLDPEPSHKAIALYAMSSIGGRDSVTRATEIVTDDEADQIVLDAAIEVLAKHGVGAQESLSRLVESLDERGETVQERLYFAVACMLTPETIGLVPEVATRNAESKLRNMPEARRFGSLFLVIRHAVMDGGGLPTFVGELLPVGIESVADLGSSVLLAETIRYCGEASSLIGRKELVGLQDTLLTVLTSDEPTITREVRNAAVSALREVQRVLNR